MIGRKYKEKQWNIKAKLEYQKGYIHRVTDLMAFKKLLQSNTDKTSKKLASLWPRKISNSAY
ncbi:hypothetical protein [Orientia tsutsugamushi]|uniref:hypothetical protein n=1 Tax=Orientia tsutsugamushi TaxID=784 RepID=UPI0002EF6DBC|nr:hypothetical protein [Orientia tsutsugamushi]